MLDDLPGTAQQRLLHFLDPKTILRLALISKSWQLLCESSFVWKSLVARRCKIPVNSLVVQNESYKKLFRKIRVGRPTGIDINREIANGLVVTNNRNDINVSFQGRIGGNQAVFGNEPLITAEEWNEILEKNEEIVFLDVVRQTESGKNYYSLRERSVVYYEISIIAPENNSALPNDSSLNWCTAIGLALDTFSTKGRMPGWRKDSFAYHGDDGKIFHEAVHEYGPVFGAGKTIGCGLDLLNGHIFFTLDGINLDIAFDCVPVETYYPVVGLDTRDIIHFNFGQKPFLYDFKKTAQKTSRTFQLSPNENRATEILLRRLRQLFEEM